MSSKHLISIWTTRLLFLGAALLSCAPWIFVKYHRVLNNGNAPGELTVPRQAITESVATQSGWQAATGRYSDVPFNPFGREADSRREFAREPDPALLVILCMVCLPAGMLAAFVMRPGHHRVLVLAVASSIALVLVAMQHTRGYPIEANIVENNSSYQQEWERNTDKELERIFVGPGRLDWKFSMWYWGFVSVLCCCVVAVSVEYLMQRKCRSSHTTSAVS